MSTGGSYNSGTFNGPDGLPPSGAPGDLVTLAVATSELAASLPTDVSALPACITAASAAVRRYTGRDFALTSYDETYNAGGSSSFLLRQYPVDRIDRIAISPTAVLTVRNNDPATNQRASAALATTGDAATGLTPTGIVLTRVASGVTYADSSTAFGTFLTVRDAAANVNGLGGGWQATAATGYELWATSDLRAVQGAQNALAGSGGAGAVFLAFVTDVNNWTLNERTGEVRLTNQQYDPVFALMNVGGSPLLSTFPPGFQNIRVAYTAGYATVPADVQQACLMTVQAMLYDLQKSRAFQSASAAAWSYTLAGPGNSGLPDAAKKLLFPHRAFRRY